MHACLRVSCFLKHWQVPTCTACLVSPSSLCNAPLCFPSAHALCCLCSFSLCSQPLIFLFAKGPFIKRSSSHKLFLMCLNNNNNNNKRACSQSSTAKPPENQCYDCCTPTPRMCELGTCINEGESRTVYSMWLVPGHTHTRTHTHTHAGCDE